MKRDIRGVSNARYSQEQECQCVMRIVCISLFKRHFLDLVSSPIFSLEFEYRLLKYRTHERYEYSRPKNIAIWSYTRRNEFSYSQNNNVSSNVPDVYASARATMLGHNFRGEERGEDFTRVRVHLLHGAAYSSRLTAVTSAEGATRHGEARPGDSCATGGHKDPATSCQGFLRRIPCARGDIAADWFNREHTVLQSCARHGIRVAHFHFSFHSRTHILILLFFFALFTTLIIDITSLISLDRKRSIFLIRSSFPGLRWCWKRFGKKEDLNRLEIPPPRIAISIIE